MKRLYQTLTFLILLFYSQMLAAQDLSNARQGSHSTRVYRIENEQALKIFNKGDGEIDSTFFKNFVLEYPSDSVLKSKLEFGHYLFINAKEGRLFYQLRSISNVDIKFLNNARDLKLIVIDSLGREIKDAEIRLKDKIIKYNSGEGCYILKNRGKNDILSVNHKDHATYFSMGWRNYRYKLYYLPISLVRLPPIKYLWMPVRDGIRSIRYMEEYGMIGDIADWFRPKGEKYHSNYEDNFQGYMVFNKPLYRRGDTLKLKAYITRKNGKPIKKNLEVQLTSYSERSRKLGQVVPYNNGAYSFEFILHDSLELKLDRRYEVALSEGKYLEVISQWFRFEEYELKDNAYTLRLMADEHSYGKTNAVFVQGKDANGLNLMDARVKLIVRPKKVNGIGASQVFIADTLWTYQKALEKVGETRIDLPDSIFPSARFKYSVEAIFTNASFETHHKIKYAHYTYIPDHLEIELNDDQVNIVQTSGRDTVQTQAFLTTVFDSGFKNRQQIQLPTSLDVSPYAKKYRIENEDLFAELDLGSESEDMSCNCIRTSDSVLIEVINNRNIPFHYDVYKKNKKIRSGTGRSLSLRLKETGNSPYYFSLQYIWAGEFEKLEYNLNINKRQIEINTINPATVSPGEVVDMNIVVTDINGNGIPDVDLTAYALTKKFKSYSPPALPSRVKTKNRKMYSSYWRDPFKNSKGDINLDYSKWSDPFGLDSMDYYQFLYPGDSIFSLSELRQDSITQFSPFITYKGTVIPPSVVYVDDRPVYFRDVDVKQPYSIRIDSGYHKITLRSKYYRITLDSMYFKPHHKTLFSVDRENPNPEIFTEYAGPDLSDYELKVLYKYMIPLKFDYVTTNGYLNQGETYQLLENRGYGSGYLLAGPFNPRYIYFNHKYGWEIPFDFESNYLYTFRNGLLKMKEFDTRRYLKLSSHFDYRPEFGDSVLTIEEIKKRWAKKEDLKQVVFEKYSNPYYTGPGMGRLTHSFDPEKNEHGFIKNILIFGINDLNYIRVHPGSTEIIHQLAPENYQVIFLLEDNHYINRDSVKIKADGLNFLDISESVIHAPDSFSHIINEVIRANIIYENVYLPSEKKKEIHRIRQEYIDQFRQPEFSNRVIGKVVAASDGSGVPGVNVIVKGTTIGTVTDIEGNYKLDVPDDAVLVYSFIGYISQEMAVRDRTYIDVMMEEDVMQLSEVVVTAMGIERVSKSLGYSVTKVDPMMTLSGKVAGVSIVGNSGAPGSSTRITIRGNSTLNAESKPLVVIDGIIVTSMDSIDANSVGSISVLQGSTAAAIYGSRAANGVILITTKSGQKGKSKNVDLPQPASAQNENSIRSNFSDYAFWQPRLRTDKDGTVNFRIRFPDDITGWNYHILAMGNKKVSGSKQTFIQSLKSVSSSLSSPRFLVESDQFRLIGKTLNYTSDSLKLNTRFTVNGKQSPEKLVEVRDSKIEYHDVAVPAGADTMTFQYEGKLLEKGDLDGERRKVPVFKAGTREVRGGFFSLDVDSTYSVSLNPELGETRIYIEANLLNILRQEIYHVHNYKYLCNEQSASKLKVLLMDKRIAELLGEEFEYDAQIRKLIAKLEKNQNSDGSWGWWNQNSGSWWISLHVAEAMNYAEKEGYPVNVNWIRMKNYLTYEINGSKDPGTLYQTLKLFRDRDMTFESKDLIQNVRNNPDSTVIFKLQLMALEQLAGKKIQKDSIMNLSRTNLYGNLFWEGSSNSVFRNELITTSWAYRILRESKADPDILLKTRNYLIEKRSNGYWRNTFESTFILETLLDEVLQQEEIRQPMVRLNEKEIREFPYEYTYSDIDSLNISMEGTGGIYFGYSQETFNPSPEPVDSLFRIKRYFISGPDTLTRFEAGRKVKYIIEVELSNDLDYAFLEAPIPSGCSYGEKRQFRWKESHREYDLSTTNIFLQKMRKGRHKFEIELIPRYSGTFVLNPVRLEHMYFPVFFGRNEMQRIEIESTE